MNFKNTEVWGFNHSLRGMRNPKNSWNRSDSMFGYNQCGTCNHSYLCNKCMDSDPQDCAVEAPIIGKNDMDLAQRLIKAGSEHRKFLRQIMVSVDITAPLYWWKEYDTYKVGTVANSTSTMHKLTSTQITSDCFERSRKTRNDNYFLNFINHLESLRKEYIETKDKEVWETLIQELPSSWLQTRTITMNYENLYSMYRHRRNHKLIEWSKAFINWIGNLPYAEEFIKYGSEESK